MDKLRLTLLFVLLFTFSAAGAELVPLQDGAAGDALAVTVLAESETSLSLRVEAAGVLVEPMTGDAAGHARLFWENGGVEGAIGAPQIPVKRMLVAIPYGATVSASATVERSSDRDFTAFTGANSLMPVQPPREKRPGPAPPFTKDDAAYARAGYGDRPLVEVEDYVIVRGRRLALVTVRPVAYDPAAGRIRIDELIRVELTFTGGDPVETQARIDRYQTPRWASMINEVVVNPSTRELDELPASFGYLVISVDNADYIDALQPYLEWKTAMGYEVTHVTTTDIGSSAAEIKAYIQQAYDTWPTPPSFVLLVGDTPGIPHWTGNGTGNPATDLNYVQLEGADYFADIGIGRWSIANLTDLENAIDKTMNYEHVLWTEGDDWVQHANFMASVDNWQISEGTHNFVLDNYLYPAGYTADLLYQVTYGADTQDVIDSFNGGVSLGTYSGHGSEDSWSDGPPFSQANVNSLVNTVFPFVQSYSCLTGKFQVAECFGETWLRADHAAFAFMGSTVTSYWDEDDILEKRVYEGFFDNQTPDDIYDLTWINGMVDYGKLKLYEHYGNTGMVRRYFEMYNILGDGSIDLWTVPPVEVTVNHPAAFFLGMTEVEISVPDAPSWAVACAMSTSEPDLVASGYVDETGSVTLELPDAPTLPGTLKIVVTGHNVEPYIAEIPLTAAEGAYVVYESAAVNDAGCWNPNGVLDYSETALLAVTMQNVGVEDSGDPTAVTMTGVENLVTFLDNYEAYPAIPADGSITIEDGYELQVEATVADGALASVPVLAADSWDFWESTMPLLLHAPAPVATDVTFDDSDGGNGNNWLDPGENAWVTFTVTNDGSSPIINGYATAHSGGDQYVDIITDNAEFLGESFDPGESVDISYGIMALEDCPQDYDVTLHIEIEADHNYAKTVDMPVTVGDVLFVPTGPDEYGYLAYDPNDGPSALPTDWVEIAPSEGGPGTDAGISGDDQCVHHDLPFTFTYYGEDHDEFNIDSNGWIAFGTNTPSSDYSNTGIPNIDGPTAMVAPYWEDLNPSRPQSDGIFIWHDEANHRFIVEWHHIDQYSPSGNFETFELILYDPAFHPTQTGDGIIQFQYFETSNDFQQNGTIGVEDPGETDGVEYFFDGSYDIHASPIEPPFSITVVPGELVPLPYPEDLTATLIGPVSGAVALDWEFTPEATFAELTEPAVQGEGEKPDVLRDEDRAQLADWRENGVPGGELDDFLNFRVYRDGEMIGEPVESEYEDQLPEHGEHTYRVTALHDEGESYPSNEAAVTWDPLAVLALDPVSNVIMPNGGNYTYTAHLTATNQQPFPGADYWTTATLPNGNVIGPVFQATFTVPPNADITVGPISQYVPGAAPGGSYIHTSKVGLYPFLTVAQDSFQVIKFGDEPGGVIDLSDWACSGWDLGETVVAADEKPLPEQFAVGDAYPNPFNAAVTVPFALPDAGRVEIALYNVLGRLVHEQALERGPGYHSLTIDGSTLGSGVYLLRVEGFNEVVSRKLLLVK